MGLGDGTQWYRLNVRVCIQHGQAWLMTNLELIQFLSDFLVRYPGAREGTFWTWAGNSVIAYQYAITRSPFNVDSTLSYPSKLLATIRYNWSGQASAGLG